MDKGRISHFTLRVLALLLAAALCAAVPAMAEETPQTRTLRFEARQGTADGPSNAAMMQGYVNQLLYPDRTPRSPRNMGARLTGNEAKLYQKLKDIIVDIAAGRRASTVVELPLEEIMETTVFTPESLGVPSLTVDGEITDEALEAVYSATDVQIPLLLNALVEDMPYELYWFDKTDGIYTVNSMSLSFTSTRIELSGFMRLSMVVAQEFAGGNNETVDTSWGAAAQAAAKNAKDIVQKNSGLGDLDKLRAYKNAVCELVDYDYGVPNSAPYGNSWQIIWVFDGNPATKVLCEGYSKAFKYLCDLSAFRGNVTVGTASGLIVSSSSTTRHMWNIVAMSDGKNYLADVTNCDSGHTGYPDQLFLKGYVAGDAANGYEYNTTYGNIRYIYDQQVNNLYYAGELEMSGQDYQNTGSDPVPAVKPGNVTGDADGTVDGRDLLRLARFLAGQDVEIDPQAADVNGDGAVDGRDLLRLARYLAGQDVELTAPSSN